jgi:SLT domain-containing protein
MLGGESGISAINRQAQRFAWGGVTGLPQQMTNAAAGVEGNANATVLAEVLAKINGEVTTKLAAQAAAALAASSSGAALGGNVVSWIEAAMKDTGAPASWLSYLLALVAKESGGNPNAVDPISVMGEHASGLFQTLPSTYAEYATVAGGYFNPIADAVAGIRYIQAEYGSPANIPGLLSGHYVGYDSGGYLMPGLTMAYNGTGSPERVSPPGGGGDTHVHFEVGGKEIAHAVLPDLATLMYQKAARNRGNSNAGQYWVPGAVGPPLTNSVGRSKGWK